MRVDIRSTMSSPVNPYNAATEKTVAARRSNQPRKKPVKRAASIRSWAGLNQASAIGQWMNGGRGHALTKKQRPAIVAVKAPDLA